MDKHIKAILVESYDNNSRLRDRDELALWKINEMDKFLSYLEPTDHLNLLDIGSGPGQHSMYFKQKGLNAACVDISPNMVNACKEKGLEAYVMDLYALDFGERVFDAVWSMNCLLHVPKSSLELVLRNIKAFLKPGGYFYLGVYGGYDFEGIWEDDPYSPNRFFSFYEDEELKKAVSSEFELVHFESLPMEGMSTDYQSLVLRKAGDGGAKWQKEQE
ncbi:class I SAM-dependent methyltransferase [Paenibacillus eucommiae]|uniref:SAM-dependent methyltransferase n=1 Tax=Paenibacillus eucommiae TaxID=1355755 RepID=A0ABS4IUA5_9BACL|nr:class I SAM-dependent methyltransferase [Paenibacillus eucommiae]MBP1990601.1 SAM-dependent methyltransferase [Paenibacillus eucommiae]